MAVYPHFIPDVLSSLCPTLLVGAWPSDLNRLTSLMTSWMLGIANSWICVILLQSCGIEAHSPLSFQGMVRQVSTFYKNSNSYKVDLF